MQKFSNFQIKKTSEFYEKYWNRIKTLIGDDIKTIIRRWIFMSTSYSICQLKDTYRWWYHQEPSAESNNLDRRMIYLS